LEREGEKSIRKRKCGKRITDKETREREEDRPKIISPLSQSTDVINSRTDERE
jgi:hypothetical protein